MQKLITCVMGGSCSKFVNMCLNSIKNSEDIVFLYDLNSTDDTLKVIKEWSDNNRKINIIERKYDQDKKSENGTARNFYLEYLKQHHMGEWVLVLDADEVVEDLDKIKEFINVIQEEAEDILFSVKMRHFIGDLGHEDATTPEHFVPHRLFKVREDLTYPLGEHPVLGIKSDTIKQPGELKLRSANYRGTTIWHLAYMPGMWEIKKRYDNHMKKSEIHTPEFLKNWYYAHLFGNYPKSQVNPTDIPEIILKEFGIDKDEFYFANRVIEPKHFFMTKQWVDYFTGSQKPEFNVIEFGCGRGPFGVGFLNQNCNYTGIELSNFAVKNAFVQIKQGNILEWDVHETEYDLCVVFDVLEHLKYEDLDKALENIKDCAFNFIFSVPVIGDPNLENDKTHIIKETKQWWIEKLSKYFYIAETPKDWLFANQIIIGERKC